MLYYIKHIPNTKGHFPTLQKESQIFPPTTGGIEKMAKDMKIPFLGRLPLDPLLGN